MRAKAEGHNLSISLKMLPALELQWRRKVIDIGEVTGMWNIRILGYQDHQDIRTSGLRISRASHIAPPLLQMVVVAQNCPHH